MPNVPSAQALSPISAPTPKWWPFFAALIVLLTLWPLALVFAPSLMKVPRYEVAGGQITAYSLASRTVIPAGIPAEATSLRLLRRDYGSSMAGYQVGRFTSERGPVALYGDGSSSGVLFATQPPTFLTPTDPDAHRP